MANMTLRIPEDLKKKMKEFPEINWSELARAAISKRVFLLSKLKEFTQDSEITEKDALELGRKINKSLHKKYKNETNN